MIHSLPVDETKGVHVVFTHVNNYFAVNGTENQSASFMENVLANIIIRFWRKFDLKHGKFIHLSSEVSGSGQPDATPANGLLRAYRRSIKNAGYQRHSLSSSSLNYPESMLMLTLSTRIE